MADRIGFDVRCALGVGIWACKDDDWGKMKVSSRRDLDRIRSARDLFLVRVLVGYVHIWIIEGAARKWIPGMSTPFYIARDAYIIGALLFASIAFRGARERGRAASAGSAVAIFLGVALLMAIADGPSAVVTLLGLRNYLAPVLPILLVLGFDKRDFAILISVSRVIARYAAIELLIVLWQVNSPLTSIANVQADGTPSILITANDVARASGTFTSPAGLVAFLPLLAASTVILMARRTTKLDVLPWTSFIATVVIAAVGGARSGVFAVAAVFAVWLAHTLVATFGAQLRQFVGALVLGVIGYVAVGQIYPAVLQAFGERFDAAAKSENTSGRIMASITGFLGEPFRLLGSGVGSHSNVATGLGVTSEWIEGDSMRWVAELGILGLFLAVARLATSVWLAASVVVGLRKRSLAHALLGAAVIPVMLAGSITTMPTVQGAFGITFGLLLIERGTYVRADRRSIGVVPKSGRGHLLHANL